VTEKSSGILTKLFAEFSWPSEQCTVPAKSPYWAQHFTGVTDKDCVPPVISTSQPRLRICFTDLISDNAETDLLRFEGEKIRDVCMI